MILYVKNAAGEGPETLGDFFVRQGLASRTVELWRGDGLPQDYSALRAVVVLGGPMNVYEEEKYPFLTEETEFIRKVVLAKIPYLGICLGAQLLAKAFGAAVGRSPEKEVGFYDVTVNSFGKKDFLFQGVSDTIKVFQWHEDAFEIPVGSRNLASSRGCPHQAFRVGPCAYGLQFHVEISEQTIRAWTKDSLLGGQDKSAALVDEYRRSEIDLIATREQIYKNFLCCMTS